MTLTKDLVEVVTGPGTSLAGERGPVRDAVLLNAAATIAAFDGVLDDVESAIRHGLPRAAEAVDSGEGTRLLDRWIEASRRAAGP